MRYASLFLCMITLSFGLNYIAHAQPMRLLTNLQGEDGFGSQFLNIIAAVVHAELHGMKFVYTPFKSMEHNYSNDPEFLKKKEQLINFIDNFEVKGETKHVDSTGHAIQFFYSESNLAYLIDSPALKKIKKIFRANKNICDYFSSECLSIVVHVRRPNQHDSRVDGTDTPDDFFLNIINYLRTAYASQNPSFHLHSQGNNIEHFKQYIAPDVTLHLNESVEDSFIAMVFADVLVTSRSDFSYTAALLSDGVVYYIPYWHSHMPHWISVHDLLANKNVIVSQVFTPLICS